MPHSILIRNALIVAGPAAAPPFFGQVEIRGGQIASVQAGAHPADADEVIDAEGCALLPGLVNTHAHSHSSLTRGSAEATALDDWLKVIEAEQSRLTEQQAYIGALATYAEALLSGTTAIMDMCLFPEATYRAARDIGIRAVIAPYVADTKPFTPDLADTARLLARTASDDARVKIFVGLHDLESCSDAQIGEGIALAREFGTGVHLHCSETERQVERTRSRTGRSPVAQLGALGALGRRTLLAHCVWVDDDDRRLLAESGTHVAHCPHANLKLGSGIAPVADLNRRGINVALATDGAKANNRLDLFDVMKFASLLPKGIARDPTLLPPAEILDMATRRGAAALDIPAGAIIAGLAADLIMVRLDAFHTQPMLPETACTNLVHAARGSDVAMTMVAGEILTRNGRLTSSRWTTLAHDARRVGLDLIAAQHRSAT
ncbi:5-methylthioadenosine/S-adenosylhomocysteine deaminase [Nitrobacteraceae bacterium AZCC 2161]